MAWARRSGEAWRKYPAAGQLYGWARRIELARILALPVDVGGTYAAQIDLPSGRRIALTLRTSGEVEYPWTGSIPEPPSIEPWEYREQGYRVSFWIASEERDLPRIQGGPSTLRCRYAGWDPDRPPRRIAGGPPPGPVPEVDLSCFRAPWAWRVALPPEPEGPRRGNIDLEMLPHLFPDDEEIAELLDLYGSGYRARSLAGEKLPALGQFSRGPAGDLEFRQTLEAAPGRVIRLSAVRVSRDVVREAGN